ncbi:hypothetical protein [Bartonella krasnovii]|nr:hypothetical protein [Bartonella krasnovii]
MVFFPCAFEWVLETTGLRASRERPNRPIIALIFHCENTVL